jgi:hypothetical protein
MYGVEKVVDFAKKRSSLLLALGPGASLSRGL